MMDAIRRLLERIGLVSDDARRRFPLSDLFDRPGEGNKPADGGDQNDECIDHWDDLHVRRPFHQNEIHQANRDCRKDLQRSHDTHPFGTEQKQGYVSLQRKRQIANLLYLYYTTITPFLSIVKQAF